VIDENPSALSPLRQLLIGGEALSVPHVREALERLPDTDIINGYGPTESTTFACCYRIPRPLPQHIPSIPIGRPIGNTEVYVLDESRNPVPVGVVGELYIGGDGLARGYLNQPEMTAEKFLPHPFRSLVQARVYRTGDLVRYRPDGAIEFLGRVDDQVKIRGFRIEPGEIEATLAGHSAVRMTAVVAHEDGTGDKRLVVYVVPLAWESPESGELRAFLERKLPDYMVPSQFVFLESLPLTPSGKVDRRALPAKGPARAKPEESVPPRDPLEVQLAKTWEEVLRIGPIGVRDNFFDLGGHSLLVMSLAARIERAFGRSLPLVTLFEAPTIEQQARVLRKDGGEAAQSGPVSI